METVVILRKRKRREQIAELLTQLPMAHPTQTMYVAWDNADTHSGGSGGEVNAVVLGAAGRLVLLYLPAYSPWLNPIEMRWRHWRREVIHCELFESIKKRMDAPTNFFACYNQVPHSVLSIISATRQVFLKFN